MGRTISARTPGSTWDNGIYAADAPDAPAFTITAADLPAYCCHLGPMFRSQPCPRAAGVDTLHMMHAGIVIALKRHGRIRHDWRARNHAGHIAYLIRELDHFTALFANLLPACTAAPANRFDHPVHDREVAMPACTC